MTCLSRALDGRHPESLGAGWFHDYWVLGFDSNRLTIADFRDVPLLAVSLHLRTRLCPLQAFLMPAYSDNSIGFGRVRTEVLFNFRYVVYVHCCCGLAPRRMKVMGHSLLVDAIKTRPSVTSISVHLHF